MIDGNDRLPPPEYGFGHSLLRPHNTEMTQRYFDDNAKRNNKLPKKKMIISTFVCCLILILFYLMINKLGRDINYFVYWFVILLCIGSSCCVCFAWSYFQFSAITHYAHKSSPGKAPFFVQGDGKIKSTDKKVNQYVRRIIGYDNIQNVRSEDERRITIGCKAIEWHVRRLNNTDHPLMFKGYQWFHHLQKHEVLEYKRNESYNMLKILSDEYLNSNEYKMSNMKILLEKEKKKKKKEMEKEIMEKYIPNEKLRKYLYRRE